MSLHPGMVYMIVLTFDTFETMLLVCFWIMCM